MILLFKYKIRVSIPLVPPRHAKHIIDSEKRAKKDKYEIMTADNIYKKIMKIL